MKSVLRKNLLFGCCSLGIIAAASAAQAEDDYLYNQPKSPATKASPNDQQYKIPNYYNGKYYPDDEAVISYHGTSNSASAQNQKALDGNGSYYYYYY